MNSKVELLNNANKLRWQIGDGLHDTLLESIYANAASIADKTVKRSEDKRVTAFDRQLDKVLTSRRYGFPLMFLMLAVVFWITIVGANYPSSMLASLLIDTAHPILKSFGSDIGLPFWLNGLIIDGAYLSMAWVISVMLPPMAIFFPLFTLLEDFGYLPRVAFNMDNLFRKAGAHGDGFWMQCSGSNSCKSN